MNNTIILCIGLGGLPSKYLCCPDLMYLSFKLYVFSFLDFSEYFYFHPEMHRACQPGFGLNQVPTPGQGIGHRAFTSGHRS